MALLQEKIIKKIRNGGGNGRNLVQDRKKRIDGFSLEFWI